MAPVKRDYLKVENVMEHRNMGSKIVDQLVCSIPSHHSVDSGLIILFEYLTKTAHQSWDWWTAGGHPQWCFLRNRILLPFSTPQCRSHWSQNHSAVSLCIILSSAKTHKRLKEDQNPPVKNVERSPHLIPIADITELFPQQGRTSKDEKIARKLAATLSPTF